MSPALRSTSTAVSTFDTGGEGKQSSYIQWVDSHDCDYIPFGKIYYHKVETLGSLDRSQPVEKSKIRKTSADI